MKITAPDLVRLGVIDAIVPEPVAAPTELGRGRREPPRALRDHLRDLASKSGDAL